MDTISYNKLLEANSLMPIMMDFGNYLDTYYYLGAIQVSAVLLEKLDADVKFIDSWNLYSYIAFTLLFSGLAFTVLIQNQRMAQDFTKSIFVFPFGLIERNIALKNYLQKKVLKSGSFF